MEVLASMTGTEGMGGPWANEQEGGHFRLGHVSIVLCGDQLGWSGGGGAGQ